MSYITKIRFAVWTACSLVVYRKNIILTAIAPGWQGIIT